jgi:type II secretory pathway component PulC
MNRFLHYWLGPIVAALLASYVFGTWVLRLWVGKAHPPERQSTSALDVFPNAPAQTAAPVAAATSLPANVVLVGTVIPRNESEAKRAVMRVDGKSLDLEEGAELADGTTLSRVERQAVVLTRAGKDQRVELTKASPTASSVSAARPSAPASSVPTPLSIASGCPATPEQKRAGIVLNTELLAGALQNQTSLDSMLVGAGGGLAVRNSAGVGSLLGLRDGDVIRTVGGARVTQPRDLVTFALTPLAKAQSVSVEIERAGAAQVVTFLPPGCK